MHKIPTNSAAWFEIGVKDLDKGARFYGAVLGTELMPQDMGWRPTMIFRYDGGMSGHLYETKEASVPPIVHLNAEPPLEDVMERVTANGGRIDSEIFALPDGRFVYCRDPDGTRFGLFTAA